MSAREATDTIRDEANSCDLHTPLLVVMGHQKCGAVTAAAESGEAEGHLPSLLALIRPAVERAKGQPGDLIDNAVRINVENVVRQVRGSKPVLATLVDRGGLIVVGAVYSLDTGRVAWLPDGQPKTVGRLEPPRESAQCVGSRGTRSNEITVTRRAACSIVIISSATAICGRLRIDFPRKSFTIFYFPDRASWLPSLAS